MLAAYGPPRIARLSPRRAGLVEAKAVDPRPRQAPSRFSGSAWAFVRGGGRATALSPGGQIGGGQAGARLLYRIDKAERLALSARVSRTIGGIRQTEAAVGLDWKPIDTLPVHLMLDRRIAIDKGGRNAWTLGAAGGVDDVRIAPGWRLDGYGEAGVVGAHRRDLYADGAARIARAIDLGGGPLAGGRRRRLGRGAAGRGAARCRAVGGAAHAGRRACRGGGARLARARRRRRQARIGDRADDRDGFLGDDVILRGEHCPQGGIERATTAAIGVRLRALASLRTGDASGPLTAGEDEGARFSSARTPR